MKKTLLRCIVILTVSTQSIAADLLDVYQEALQNDSQFKAAFDTYMSRSEAIPQARAALYPQVLLSGQTGRFFNSYTSSQLNDKAYYGSNIWEVTASQAIFNYTAWAKVAQAKAAVKSAQAVFNDAAQNLILRTTKAYFNVLFAIDTLNFAEAKKRANQKQLSQATERYKAGLDTITSVYEAQAAFDQSTATVINARNNQVVQKENLRKITHCIYGLLAPLQTNKIPLLNPQPSNVDQWVDASIRQNYLLLAAKFALVNARENLKALSAGNWPVFSVQSTTVNTHNAINDSTVIVPAKEVTSNIALGMNFPIVQGGLVQSQTRQAQYDFRVSSDNFDQTYIDVVANSRIAFNTINEGINKVKADRQTVISQRNSLDSTQAQFEIGTRTMVDVVNAQQRLFEAQQQLAQDQYNLIYSTLNLKYLAGTLNANDLEHVNSWLKTTRTNGLAAVTKTSIK